MKRILAVPLSLVVAACATPVADPDPLSSVQAGRSVPAAETVQGRESPKVHPSGAAAAEQSDQGVDELVAGNDNDTAKSFHGIEDLESPGVEQIPPSMIPSRVAPETSVVCERVYPTGSILPTKVCRDKTDIQRKQEADQEIFDDIKRNTAIFNSRL